MPSEERDRQFERALQRHLRADPGERSCPDAERLAAYHERTLSREELMQCKAHIRSCVRCQETLALLEETNAIELQNGEEKGLPHQETLLTAGARGASLRTIDRVAFAREKRRAPEEERAANGSRPASWRWVIPLGALAAGLLVFVAVRENRKSVSEMARTQITANRVAPAPPPPSETDATAPRSARREYEALQADRLRDLEGNPGAERPLGSPETATSAGPTAAPHSNRLPGNPHPGDLKAGTVDSQGMAARRETKRAPSARSGQGFGTAPPAVSETAPVRTPVPGTAAGSPERAKKTRQDSEERTQEQQSESALTAIAGGAAATAPEPSAAKASELRSQSQSQSKGRVLREVAQSTLRVIAAPDGKHVWRVGAAGLIESSSDAGLSWKTQGSEVSADLSAGSAPSDTVCWVVGKAGTILLTKDGGKHWQRVTSPLREDLGGVHATDATHASIWSVDNRSSLQTADGGTTWTVAANE